MVNVYREMFSKLLCVDVTIRTYYDPFFPYKLSSFHSSNSEPKAGQHRTPKWRWLYSAVLLSRMPSTLPVESVSLTKCGLALRKQYAFEPSL